MRRSIPSSCPSLVFGAAAASAGCLRALVPARAGFAMVFFCFVIVDSVRCIAGLMPATHARFLRPHSQANGPIMALRRWPPLDTSMAPTQRDAHGSQRERLTTWANGCKLKPYFPSPSSGSSSTEWRALPSEGRGREFESRRVRHYYQWIREIRAPSHAVRGSAGEARGSAAASGVFKRKAALAGLFAGAPPTSISASTDLVLESAAKPLVDGAQGWHLDRAAVGHRLRSHHRPRRHHRVRRHQRDRLRFRRHHRVVFVGEADRPNVGLLPLGLAGGQGWRHLGCSTAGALAG